MTVKERHQNSFNTYSQPYYSQPYHLAQNFNPNTASDVASNNIDYSLYGNDFRKEFIDEMLNDKRFQNIMNNRVRINEGGYVNHPNDRGGETKFAISSRWYPRY